MLLLTKILYSFPSIVIDSGKMASPKPGEEVHACFDAMSKMSCDVIYQRFPHSRLSAKKAAIGKFYWLTMVPMVYQW
jgi:hypothetical protein